MTSHVQAVRKIAPSFAPILKTLIQLAASPQADQSKVGKILELIDGLKANLEDSLNLEHANEASAIATYNALILVLDAVIADLKGDIARLETDLAFYTAAVKDAEMRLDDSNRRITENTNLWNEKNAICEAYYAHYAAETERRDEERAVCKEAAELLEESFKDTSDHVMDAVKDVS
jgi:ABC-type transporter Mla subunit MlaD